MVNNKRAIRQWSSKAHDTTEFINPADPLPGGERCESVHPVHDGRTGQRPSPGFSKKNLPMFYFTEAGKELNIPAKTCRSWKINTWPTVNRPSDDKLIHKVAIYIRVYLRLSDYPEQETYLQATNRLQRRILEIKEKTFSHNRISQHLRISFRTLNDIIEKKPEEAIRRKPLSLGPADKVGRSRDGDARKTGKARGSFRRIEFCKKARNTKKTE